MTDIALVPLNTDGLDLPGYDIALDGADVLAESGLQTAVVMSLFTDRRADPDDHIPDGSDNPRGTWLDGWADIDGDRLGSRLWLLQREKQTQSTLLRAREYAQEALQWLIDDGVAASVDVDAEWAHAGMLALTIRITRPDGNTDTFRYEQAWKGALNAV